MTPLYITLLLLLLCAAGNAATPGRPRHNPTSPFPDTIEVRSPNGDIKIMFGLRDLPGRPAAPCYSVSFRGKPLIKTAGLGIDLAPSGLLDSRLAVTRVVHRSADSSFALVVGKARQVRDHYREAVISLSEQEAPNRRLDVVLRAYNDGVAFRYHVPRQTALADFTVTEERTTFAFAGNPTAWTLPVPSYTTPYEFQYQPRPLSEVSADALLALPLLLVYPDRTSVAITEADLTDYAGMYLGGAGTPGVLTSRLSPRLDDPALKVKAKLPHDTPWRLLMIRDEPGRLIESNLVEVLNPPCAIKDTSWIHPGKTAFPWWNGFEVDGEGFQGGLNTRTMKYYIDFCAANGIPYHSLDGLDNIAWYGGTIVPYVGQGITEGLPGLDLPEVIAYAKQKGVRLRLWMHSGAPRAHMKTAFPLYEKWGIEGVMVDFVERDDQETNNFIREMVALAARHHLTVTLHNIAKPTGLTRTYPNLLTVEAVYNLEFNKWDPVGVTPEHDLIVPFTRMLAGPTDFHSGSFRNVTAKQFEPRNVGPLTVGTRARQIARYVVYDGWLPMMADSPNAYRNQPGLALLVDMPVTWDESKVLSGEVGQHIAVARRSGKQWYIGCMTDSNSRALSLPLRFLGPGAYTAEIWHDDTTNPDKPTRILYQKQSVTARTTLKAILAPAGGQIIRLTPHPAPTPNP